MDFSDLLEKRYSVRQLSDREVDDEQIKSILEAARLAPTAANRQPFKVWVLKSEEARKKAEGAFKFDFARKAQVIFVIGALPDKAWVRPADHHNFATIDAAIAATAMMYEVANLGLGTTWIGHFNPEKLKQAFPQMEPYVLIAIFGVGCPADDAAPNPLHFQRKTLEELSETL